MPDTELRATEARLRTLVDALDDAFCVIRLIYEDDEPVDYLFLDANQAFQKQTGLTDPIGQTIRGMVPDIDHSWFRIYGQVAATGEPVRMENHDPALARWFDLNAHRVGDGTRGEVAILFKDITSRKKFDAEREALLVRERDARLQAESARAQAESANRMKDEFLSTVSHELRTPLNAMLGWSAMLQRGGLDQPTTERALATIERNARAQARLIEDLLDLSRVIQGKFTLAVGPVELVRLVEAALDSVRPAAEAKGVRIQPVLDSHATIVGDAERLQQIFWNLLSNAIKFTPKGGRVQVTLRRAPSFVELVVADTGVGIAPAFVQHVFEPFRQADGTITRRVGGLGLGLSIVRSLVEMHGGTVTAASDGEGQGATFSVRLPMAPLRAEAVPAASARSAEEPAPQTFECPPGMSGLRVLVVDDEKDTRELLAYVLGQCESLVTTAGSAAEAFALLESRTFDVLVSDIGMPEEDGLSLIRRVRKLPADGAGRIPAIALTAYARIEDRAQVLRAGFNMHVTKPLDANELPLVIAALLPRA